MDGLKIISGTSNPELATKIAEHLGLELCDLTLDRFADGEIHAQINENIRGVDVFLIQSHHAAGRESQWSFSSSSMRVFSRRPSASTW